MDLKSLPDGLPVSVCVLTLVINGEESPEVMRQAAHSLTDALPDGRYRALKGQGYDIVPSIAGSMLEEFFLAQPPPGNKSGDLTR